MPKNFHKKEFDDETKIKLDLFQNYIRNWIPTFLTKSNKTNFRKIKIYDFFSGPGYDKRDNPGSPIIIVNEIKNYCKENAKLKANVDVVMFFNDIKQENIDLLKKNITEISCKKDCCKIKFLCMDFKEAFKQCLPEIESDDSAKLIIMDQFGIKDVSPEIISKLATCNATDILFFLSSSFIYRFKETLGSKIGVNEEDLLEVKYKDIHNHITDYFRSQIKNQKYHLAPFSIKKGANIYGVIFGSGHFKGLEKFLDACWKIDPINGTSNYNINEDFTYHGQMSLLPEDNVLKKVDLFEKDLLELALHQQPNNIQVYEFVLLHGFNLKKAREILIELQDSGKIEVKKITGEKSRKHSFYLREKEPIIRLKSGNTYEKQ